MSQRQAVSEAARFNLHARALQDIFILLGREHQGPCARTLAGEQQAVESHGDCGPQTALAIMDAEDQSSLGRERRTASLQQGQLLLRGEILQDIQNKNQTRRRKFEMAHVPNAHVCVQGAESPASDCDPMRIQVATGEMPAAVTESRKTESHAVAAAEIHDRSRSQVFGGQRSEYSIQPQLPPDESTVEPRALCKGPIHEANALPQSTIAGRPQMNDQCGNSRANAADQYAEHKATHHKGQKIVFHMRSGQGGKIPGLK